jgi:hypothetical protein
MTAAPVNAQAVIRAAMAVAREAAEGQLDIAVLNAGLAAALREAFGTVVGPGDPAWPLQVEVCRAVLAHGGVPVAELREWAAALERREATADGSPVPPPAGAGNVSERGS